MDEVAAEVERVCAEIAGALRRGLQRQPGFDWRVDWVLVQFEASSEFRAAVRKSVREDAAPVPASDRARVRARLGWDRWQ
jgi:hypothetical protein